MDPLLAAIFGALATAVIAPLMIASVDVSRHDRQVAERDEDLEEWIVTHHRNLKRRWHELAQQRPAHEVPQGVSLTTPPEIAARTELLYAYREELRQARDFVLRIEVEERWTHRIARRLTRRPFPTLQKPTEAACLVDFWSEGTARNALTWRLQDILAELPDHQAGDPNPRNW